MQNSRRRIVVAVALLLLQFVAHCSTGILSPLMFLLFGRPPGGPGGPGGPGPYWHGPPPWHRPPRPPPWHGEEVDEVIVEHVGPARPPPTVVRPVIVPVPMNTAQPAIVQPVYQNPVQPMQPMPTYPSVFQPQQPNYVPQPLQSGFGQLPTAPINPLGPQTPVIPMPQGPIQQLGPSPPPSPIYPRK